MIISHKHKFIYISVPKTGTSSVIDAFMRNFKVQTKNIKKGIFSPLYFDRKTVNKHITALELREVVGDEIWNSYFKFSFVRNPWDLIVSQYFFYKRKGQAPFSAGTIPKGDYPFFLQKMEPVPVKKLNV